MDESQIHEKTNGDLHSNNRVFPEGSMESSMKKPEQASNSSARHVGTQPVRRYCCNNSCYCLEACDCCLFYSCCACNCLDAVCTFCQSCSCPDCDCCCLICECLGNGCSNICDCLSSLCKLCP